MPTYKPGYDEATIRKESTQVNVSGLSPRDNLSIEEGEQRRVAENETWLLARRHSMTQKNTYADLESLGFTILGEADDLFYKVRPPTGWTKETSGYWTTVKDATGKERISQFFKGAWYDREAFLNIR